MRSALATPRSSPKFGRLHQYTVDFIAMLPEQLGAPACFLKRLHGAEFGLLRAQANAPIALFLQDAQDFLATSRARTAVEKSPGFQLMTPNVVGLHMKGLTLRDYNMDSGRKIDRTAILARCLTKRITRNRHANTPWPGLQFIQRQAKPRTFEYLGRPGRHLRLGRTAESGRGIERGSSPGLRSPGWRSQW